MTDQGASIEAEPLSWPRAAIGAAFFFVVMIVLFAAIPNILIGSEPSQPSKAFTVVYVVVMFALVVWAIAAWQNHVPTAPVTTGQRVSAFGRPMREGPGFASFAAKAAPPKSSPSSAASISHTGSTGHDSSFGRPLKKRSS